LIFQSITITQKKVIDSNRLRLTITIIPCLVWYTPTSRLASLSFVYFNSSFADPIPMLPW